MTSIWVIVLWHFGTHHLINHAEMAVKTAIECAKETENIKKEFKEKGLPDINIGSGVNTGTCIVGNMGSENRLDYSVIGDSVNLAARLEAATRNYKDENGKDQH